MIKTNNSISISLPKIQNRGPPPRITIPTLLLESLSIDAKKECNLAKRVLTELYINQDLTQSCIADIFNVQRDTVKRWLKRLDITIKTREDLVSRKLSKFPRRAFSNNKEEKAYLLGLRYGDIYATRHGRKIRVSVATTHPAMLNLFTEVFSKYSKVNRYSKFNKSRREYVWRVYSDLDSSFEFMLTKNKKLLDEILKDNEVFFSFLSGYFDCEGCIGVYFYDYLSINWIICSCDKIILSQIVNKLRKLKFNILEPQLIKKRDKKEKKKAFSGFKYNKDYWRIRLGKRSEVLDLLSKLNLKHKEKISKYYLLKELIKDPTNANSMLNNLKENVKEEVIQCKIQAKLDNTYSKTTRKT